MTHHLRKRSPASARPKTIRKPKVGGLSRRTVEELVDTGDGNASRVRIQTSSGVKAIRKYT